MYSFSNLFNRIILEFCNVMQFIFQFNFHACMNYKWFQTSRQIQISNNHQIQKICKRIFINHWKKNLSYKFRAPSHNWLSNSSTNRLWSNNFFQLQSRVKCSLINNYITWKNKRNFIMIKINYSKFTWCSLWRLEIGGLILKTNFKAF